MLRAVQQRHSPSSEAAHSRDGAGITHPRCRLRSGRASRRPRRFRVQRARLRDKRQRGAAHGPAGEAIGRAGPHPRRTSPAPDLTRAELALEGFDEVILWHVLEHLRTPREILVECRRILRPGGRLVVATPNFGSAQAR